MPRDTHPSLPPGVAFSDFADVEDACECCGELFNPDRERARLDTSICLDCWLDNTYGDDDDRLWEDD